MSLASGQVDISAIDARVDMSDLDRQQVAREWVECRDVIARYLVEWESCGLYRKSAMDAAASILARLAAAGYVTAQVGDLKD